MTRLRRCSNLHSGYRSLHEQIFLKRPEHMAKFVEAMRKAGLPGIVTGWTQARIGPTVTRFIWCRLRCRRQQHHPPRWCHQDRRARRIGTAQEKAQRRRRHPQRACRLPPWLGRAIECQQVGTGGVGNENRRSPAHENAAILVLGLLLAATISSINSGVWRVKRTCGEQLLCGWAAEGEAWEATWKGRCRRLFRTQSEV